MVPAEPPTRAKAQSDIMVGRRVNDPERESTGRRNLAEAKIADYIERTLVAAPPLTPAQIKRLSGLLRTGATK